MGESDLDLCARVERETFPSLFPPTSFGRELCNRLANYLVVEPEPGEVVGFIGVWYMADEAHIVTIGVANKHLGNGLGELHRLPVLFA